MQPLPFLELMYCIEQFKRAGEKQGGEKGNNSAKLKLRTSVHFQLELYTGMSSLIDIEKPTYF